MPANPELDNVELEYRTPKRGESYSNIPFNNTRALIRMTLGDEAVFDHDRSMEAAARMSSKSAPDIGVN